MEEGTLQPKTGKVWSGIALAGGIIAAGSVYLCYYCFIREYSKTSGPVIIVGLGLIAAFCILTAALTVGIRKLVSGLYGKFWPVSTMVISGLSLIGLIGMIILGIIL